MSTQRWLRLGGLLGFLCLTLLTIGCGQQSANTLTVLAGSELEDLKPLLPEIQAGTGLNLELRYSGSLDGAERLVAGEAVDLAWFSHGKYLSLLQGNRVISQEKIMLSPVVLGVKESKAKAWGWMDNPNLTWRDIAAKAGAGELRYAMTNPASSNSGFTALVGVSAALSAGGDTSQPETIDQTALKNFFKGQTLTAGSSGWLAERYVAESDHLDGMINYESVLMELNRDGKLQEKLYLIYPKEGIITADYPLMLINADKREAYQKLVDFLRSPGFQQKLMEQTLRRPVIPQVKLSADFPKQLLVELPFPNSLEAVDRLLFSYLDEQRIPSHPFFVLDISGSMEGDRLNQLKTAFDNLTGMDQSLTGQFARFREREQVTVITFNQEAQSQRDFQITDPQTQSQAMVQLREYVNGLKAGGATAIFSALKRAYELAAQARQSDPQRYYSIVLMSDGENNAGISQNDFLAYYRSLPEAVRRIRTFTMLFGEADTATMTRLAEATGGRVFDSRKVSLGQAFKQIRSYQ